MKKYSGKGLQHNYRQKMKEAGTKQCIKGRNILARCAKGGRSNFYENKNFPRSNIYENLFHKTINWSASLNNKMHSSFFLYLDTEHPM